MGKTKIEWAEETWNPMIYGCSKISEGCEHCYAMKFAQRLNKMGIIEYKGLTRNGQWNNSINIFYDDKKLEAPIKRKKPTLYFVNSMTDIFHESVPFKAVEYIFDTIRETVDRHIYLVLTKRPKKMKEYVEKYVIPNNVWLGISVENQKRLKERMEYFEQIDFPQKFISAEPLLDKIDIMPYTVQWVIAGGETGKEARPMPYKAVHSLAQQCAKKSIPFFLKQWGTATKETNSKLEIRQTPFDYDSIFQTTVRG